MGTATLDFGVASNGSLEHQMQRLALESAVTDNVINLFKNIVPNLNEKLRQAYDSFKVQDALSTDLKEVKNTYDKLKPKFEHASYLNYSKTLVSVPEGFKGELLPYIQMLSDMAVEVFSEANKTLGSYNYALSAFITNKDDKTTLQDYSYLYEKVEKRREVLNRKFDPFFPVSSSLPKAYLGQTISRLSDVSLLMQESYKLNLQRKNQNIKEISESIKKSIDLLDIIIQSNRKNDIHKVSGAAALTISEGAYQIGKYVEFMGVYRYRSEQAIGSVIKLVETLDRVI